MSPCRVMDKASFALVSTVHGWLGTRVVAFVKISLHEQKYVIGAFEEDFAQTTALAVESTGAQVFNLVPLSLHSRILCGFF